MEPRQGSLAEELDRAELELAQAQARLAELEKRSHVVEVEVAGWSVDPPRQPPPEQYPYVDVWMLWRDTNAWVRSVIVGVGLGLVLGMLLRSVSRAL